MSKKRYFIMLGSFLLILTLSGCFPAEKRSANTERDDSCVETDINNSSTISTFANRIDKEINENIVVAADISTPPVKEIKEVVVVPKSINVEKAILTLFGHENISDKSEHMENTQTITVVTGGNGSSMSVSPGSFYYKKNGSYQNKAFAEILFGTKSFGDLDRLNGMFTKTQLSTVNLEESTELVTSMLNELGIDNLKTPTIITLDLATLKDQNSPSQDYVPENKSTITEFDEGDEGYLFVFGAQIEGIDMTQTGYLESNGFGECIGTRIYALVTSDGLIMLRGDGIYDFGSSEKVLNESSSLDEVMAALDFKYNNVVLSSQVIVNSIMLEYVPIWNGGNSLSFTLSPYWVCYASQQQLINDAKGTIEYTERFPIYISYENAKELLIGGVV